MTGLLLDEMYSPAIAAKLRADGHDVVAVLDLEIGLASRSDEDVLAWAGRNQRCLVTENIRDFARLGSIIEHDGIILVPRRRFSRTPAGVSRLGIALTDLLVSGRVPPAAGVLWLEKNA